MARDMTPRRPDVPTPGMYAFSFVKGGHPVAARISLLMYQSGIDAIDRWILELDAVGEFATEGDPWAIEYMERVNFYGKTIDETQFQYLIALRKWALTHDPDHPIANPTRAINLRHQPPPF